jgi:hypothetical protein
MDLQELRELFPDPSAPSTRPVGAAPRSAEGKERARSAEVLRHVLRELRFPAARWQIITVAESNGADYRTRAALHRLDADEYRDLEDVLTDVARQPAEPDVAERRGGPAGFTPTTKSPVPPWPRRFPPEDRCSTR